VKELTEAVNTMHAKVTAVDDEQSTIRNDTSNIKQEHAELKEKLVINPISHMFDAFLFYFFILSCL
jgi:hypothetical protein